jgi:hypothetical protein
MDIKNASKSDFMKPRLLVSQDITRISTASDIFTLRDIDIDKKLLRKILMPGLGIEVLISDLRKLKRYHVGKWVIFINYLNKLCISHDCQLIISSGSTSMMNLLSGPVLDSILSICEIDQKSYWGNLEKWLNFKLNDKLMISL